MSPRDYHSGPEHYRAANQVLSIAADAMADPMSAMGIEELTMYYAAAQAHLSAAAIAFHVDAAFGGGRNVQAWLDATASGDAP